MRQKTDTSRLFSGPCLIFLLIFFSGWACAGNESREFRVELKASEKGDAESIGYVDLYKESYALVIGNDNYTNGWPRLSNAIKDATAVADELTRQGYEVELKTDLESEALKSALRNFFIMRGQNPEARLLLWFAGHGQTLKDEGFLVATDTPASDKPDFKLSAIHMRDFGSWVRLADSKHVLAVFDSCFAGTIFTAQRGTPPASITMAATYPVRQFLTSGDADQFVLDNGAFRELFVRALRGEENADVNFDGYLTASELGFFMSDRVTNLTQANQTPRYGKLRDQDYDRGDFIVAILEKQTALVDKSMALQSTETENLMWESVRELDTVGAYEGYLNKYPLGVFADLARLQIGRLENSQRAGRKRSAVTPAEPPPPAYSLGPAEKTVWAQRPLSVRSNPRDSAAVLGAFGKGEQIQVVAVTEGLEDPWFQVAFHNGRAFVRATGVGGAPPRKSMAELIEEKKAEIGAGGSGAGGDYTRAKCRRNCEGRSYMQMDAASEQTVEETCAVNEDSLRYENCINKAKTAYRKKLYDNCIAKC